MINRFDLNIYSEEIYPVTESEFEEVMQASAVDDNWQDYAKWSEEIEQGQIVDTPHGKILINRDCSHEDCLTTRCKKGATYQGIAI